MMGFRLPLQCDLPSLAAVCWHTPAGTVWTLHPSDHPGVSSRPIRQSDCTLVRKHIYKILTWNHLSLEIFQTFWTTLTSVPPHTDYFPLISQKLIILPERISFAQRYLPPAAEEMSGQGFRVVSCGGEPCGTLHSLNSSWARSCPSRQMHSWLRLREMAAGFFERHSFRASLVSWARQKRGHVTVSGRNDSSVWLAYRWPQRLLFPSSCLSVTHDICGPFTCLHLLPGEQRRECPGSEVTLPPLPGWPFWSRALLWRMKEEER